MAPGSGARHSPATPPRSSASSSVRSGEGRLALGPVHVGPVRRVPHPVAPAQPVRRAVRSTTPPSRVLAVPTSCHASSTSTRAGSPGAGDAHLHGVPDVVRQLVRVERVADVAPARRRHGDQAAGGALVQEAEGHRGGVPPAHRRRAAARPAGRVGVRGSGRRPRRARKAASSSTAAEQVAVGLEAVELERRAARGTAARRRPRGPRRAP